MEALPTLVGVAGHVKGEEYPLKYGTKVVVGRSRSADWSLVQLSSWTGKSKQEQEDDHAFRTISGKHFEITMYNLGSIELVNLSSNGTKLDGEAVDRTTITDVSTNSHEISFGADEVLKLELRGDRSDAEKALDDTLDKIEGEGEGESGDADEPSTGETVKPEDSKGSDTSDASDQSDESEDSEKSEDAKED
jgi:hypothetical protein